MSKRLDGWRILRSWEINRRLQRRNCRLSEETNTSAIFEPQRHGRLQWLRGARDQTVANGMDRREYGFDGADQADGRDD